MKKESNSTLICNITRDLMESGFSQDGIETAREERSNEKSLKINTNTKK